MKKILNILVITFLVFINNSCKKNNIDIVDNTSVVYNKFYATTENTKPVVKKVIEQIKQSRRYNDLEKFVTKYGFPKWDKALSHTKNEIQLDDDSSAAEEYVIIPTVIENDNKVNGFIAVETTINGINFQTFLGTDYKRFPYESTTNSEATAELMVGILLALENETFGYEKFSITDTQLSFYRAPQNSGDIALLEIKPEETTIVGETCYYEQYWWVDGQNWTPIGPPIAIFCWGGGGFTDITNLPDPSSGGSGGGSVPPYNNDYEICKKNVDEVFNSLREVPSNKRKISDVMDGNNISRNISYESDEVEGHFFTIVSLSSGKSVRTSISSPWYWDNYDMNSLRMDGNAWYGEINYSLLAGGQTSYRNSRRDAEVDYNIKIVCKYTCFSMLGSSIANMFPPKEKGYPRTNTFFADE
ncbi:MAG: hypothetical protein KGZ59_08245 [Chitinophagaceae bacterium]|nr:hypothetical protein [Chitinophagaceae bacterium]